MNRIIAKAETWMQEVFCSEKTGHDFEHLKRVVETATKIQSTEGGDLFFIQLAALFHDYPDEKLTKDVSRARGELKSWMENENLEENFVRGILRAIDAVSYRNGENKIQAQSIEEKIIQDADRLDAMGAIGIIRAFTYGASKNRQPLDYLKTNPNSTLQHFDDKLLRLKVLMQTETGKKLAEERHSFMLLFIEELKKEQAIKS
ncbi:HD domain-containing protein [Listeria valentina]|uniref:HD domain-containing protein n=1 Tax=Listeria valentina TaxID=2705293 RepID=UPI00142F7851|nr:HD domain-containing protein [Listeria valentina]